MKNKTSSLVKNTISILTNMLKSKIMGVKSKADAIRVRLLVFSLVKTRKFSLASLSSKIQNLLDKETNQEEDQSKAIVLYKRSESNFGDNSEYYRYYDDDDGGGGGDNKYPDLTHSLFDEEDEGFDQGGSVIDLVKNSKENNGEDFSLENEIDEVADLFIKRVKKHMRLEKLESFKRYQAMLGRGV